ncbi:MAG: hypothetical protein Q8Q56_04110, partial [Alphaproteobacteria bacterium]|nr:hypothetical protein [Alphaproteobacteria bacterium]
MNYKYVLLATLASVMVVGCGLPSKEKALTEEEREHQAAIARIESDPKSQYIFGHTLKVELPRRDEDICGGRGFYAEGIIAEPFKRTLRTLWTQLEKKGFSGYAMQVLDSEQALAYREEGALSGSLFFFTPQSENDFHSRVVDYLMKDLYQGRTSKIHYNTQKLGYSSVLLGLNFNDQMFIPVLNDRTIEYVLDNKNRLNLSSHYIPPKIDSDIPVTQAQIDEWNQVFVDAFKQDPFFKQFFEAPVAPADTSGSTSALAVLKGNSGVDATQMRVNGVSGSKIHLGLPMVVQLKGSVNQANSTDGMTGLVAYKLGNSVLGVIQSYANSGTGFNPDSRQ